MLVAFLSALVDPVFIAVAVLGVLFAKSAFRLRLIVLVTAMAFALLEAIPDGFDRAWLVHVGGTSLAALALAECARYVVAPAAVVALHLAVLALTRIKRG